MRSLAQTWGQIKERVDYEKQPWFGRGRRWRSGIEGRISLLKRRSRLRRCLNHGEEEMERWIGWGVIAHNLWVITRGTGAQEKDEG